jgi:hypothetical protein
VDVLFADETIKAEHISVRRKYLLASNWYYIRASYIVGTVMPTVRQVTGTASELS